MGCHQNEGKTTSASTVSWSQNNDNRILSNSNYPSPKSFWSFTHVNSCQSYTLYINLYILLNILYKTTLNIQETRKSIKSLKRQQYFIKKSKSSVSCYHMNCCLQNILHINLIFYILVNSRQVQKSKKL